MARRPGERSKAGGGEEVMRIRPGTARRLGLRPPEPAWHDDIPARQGYNALSSFRLPTPPNFRPRPAPDNRAAW